jgi:hypothetical protein
MMQFETGSGLLLHWAVSGYSAVAPAAGGCRAVLAGTSLGPCFGCCVEQQQLHQLLQLAALCCSLFCLLAQRSSALLVRQLLLLLLPLLHTLAWLAAAAAEVLPLLVSCQELLPLVLLLLLLLLLVGPAQTQLHHAVVVAGVEQACHQTHGCKHRPCALLLPMPPAWQTAAGTCVPAAAAAGAAAAVAAATVQPMHQRLAAAGAEPYPRDW